MAAQKFLTIDNYVLAMTEVKGINLEQTTVFVMLKGKLGDTYMKTFATEKEAQQAYTGLVAAFKDYLAYA